ncbi:hypothetical protein HUT18_13030 [Streptomyces sp. NA04227]|uniref:hypothetical protein n=1 Tax=Streptomyces sp. NA04227 TaxID=2742136 RepID=UPI00159151EF|nr:hypothetical protein [Streptomyces sp. NA04227]QKW07184.1 hypothetical protein HUT18_13030 [Streptomyces sp. NA04227]
MTQSGQGEDRSLPPVRHTHEGIVLPSDGGEPLLPGTFAEPAAPAGDPGRGAPVGGQAWGQPWGPDSASSHAAPPPAAPGYAWGAESEAAQQDQRFPQGQQLPYGQEVQQGQQLPPGQHGQEVQYGQQLPQGQEVQHGQQLSHGQEAQHGQPGPVHPGQAGQISGGPHAGDLPPAPSHFAGDLPPAAEPAPQATPYPQAGALPQAGELPQAGALPQTGALPQAGALPQEQPQLPPQPPQFPQPQFQQAHAQAQAQQPQHYPQAQPQPSYAQEAPGGQPYVPYEDPTQLIPPVAPGALPPENPVDSTQFLGSIPQQPAASAPQAGLPGMPDRPPAANTDAEATQYIAPVPTPPSGAPYGIRPGTPADAPAAAAYQEGGEDNRQPPAEFDSLFRTEPSEGPAATQQMPRFEQSRRTRGVQVGGNGADGPGGPGHGGGPRGPGGPGGHGGGPGGHGGHGGGGIGAAAHGAPAGDPQAPRQRRRTGSRLPLIAAVGIGIAVLGVGTGALLSAGSDKGEDEKEPVSATAPTGKPSGSPSPAPDPAKAQAVELDKLLADSNNSRSSVITSVGNVKSCTKLREASRDLRAAAQQRNGLVTRLGQLSVDKLPEHARLTASLTAAWKASASADNHYAAWADQIAKGGKKACPKGKARNTPHTASGNRQSGEATKAKAEAATLWNAIAKRYGLTSRDKSQL